MDSFNGFNWSVPVPVAPSMNVEGRTKFYGLVAYPSQHRPRTSHSHANHSISPSTFDDFHTDASRDVARRLYAGCGSSLDGIEIGMDPVVSSNVHCPLADCGLRMEGATLDCVRLHLDAHHPFDFVRSTVPNGPPAVRCSCGASNSGEGYTYPALREFVAFHILRSHLHTGYVKCRSCRTARKEAEFAVHLTMCPALARYRQPKSVHGCSFPVMTNQVVEEREENEVIFPGVRRPSRHDTSFDVKFGGEVFDSDDSDDEMQGTSPGPSTSRQTPFSASRSSTPSSASKRSARTPGRSPRKAAANSPWTPLRRSARLNPN